MATRRYVEIPNAVLLNERLSSNARFLYTLMLAHAGPHGCWVEQEHLARLAKWQTKSGQWDRWRVQRALKELEDSSIIRRERRGGRQSNRYLLDS